MNPVIPRFFRRLLLGVVMLLAAVYVSDYLFLRFKILTHVVGEPYGMVTVYDAAAMKNGKVEVYYGVPFPQICVHTLLPHQGHSPCWYLNRSTVKLLS